MTARHLLSIAGRRAVPDCVKPAGAGGFTQLFWGCASGCGNPANLTGLPQPEGRQIEYTRKRISKKTQCGFA